MPAELQRYVSQIGVSGRFRGRRFEDWSSVIILNLGYTPFGRFVDGTRLSFSVEHITDVLSEIAGVDMLVGFRGGLRVFVAEGALGGSRAAFAVENVADAAACTVGLEVVNRTIGIDSRFLTQVAENSAHAPSGEVRWCDFVLAQECLDVVLFEKGFDLFVRNSLLGEVLAYPLGPD